MSQIQSTSRQNCVLLTVLCGKYVEKQRTPVRLAPEAKRLRLSYPFPELSSSGRLEVHALINPTIKQFQETQQGVQPNLLYIQGQQLENEEIGTLAWGDADVLDPQMFCSLISPPFPTIHLIFAMRRCQLFRVPAAIHGMHFSLLMPLFDYTVYKIIMFKGLSLGLTY